MQRRPRRRAVLSLAVAGGLVLAACGSDDSGSDETTAAPESPDTTAASTETTATGTETTTAGAGDVDLSGICPDTVVIQIDWNPEAEHGFIYNMVGDNPTIDKSTFRVTGPLVASGGVETGVDIEVRAGGPAIGFQTVTSQIYTDDSILLGFATTDEAIQNSAEFPTVAIESGFNKSPLMLMWDPATYPDVKTIEDIGTEGILVRYFGSSAYMDYLTSSGILSASQVDGSYDGTPANFVAAEGKDAQQGFASAEPYIYLNEVPEWGKPVSYAYVADTGWDNYAESLATKPENITKYADCFTKLVPIIQQSSVDYLSDPAETNALILDAVEQYDNGWVYTPGVAEYSVETMQEDGLMADGPDGVVGKFDMDRVTTMIETAGPVFESLGQAPKEGLTAEDIVTNQFLDESISYG